ncbi:MAG: hypothetical protein QOG53_116 [Frankiales bacterium]|nr:hypothetical protein [Frankiales bacterium]
MGYRPAVVRGTVGRLTRKLRTARSSESAPRFTVFAWFPDGEIRGINPAQGFYRQPCVSPDGGSAVFWGGPAGAPRIFHSNLTGQVQPLGPPWARHPSFGADGRYVVCAAQPEDDPVKESADNIRGNGAPHLDIALGIVVVDMTTGASQRVTSGPHIDQRPALSPDGRRIAFTSNREPSPGLWVVDVDGTHLRPLSVAGYRAWWSGDNRTLYFSGVTGDRSQIHRADADDDVVTPIPLSNDDRGQTFGPFLDPSGQRLLVHSTRDDGCNIYELPLDESPMRRLEPPGLDGYRVSHVTRAASGVFVFDAVG